MCFISLTPSCSQATSKNKDNGGQDAHSLATCSSLLALNEDQIYSAKMVQPFDDYFEPKPNHFARKNTFFPPEVLDAVCPGATVGACTVEDLGFAASGEMC